jgi:hypothetical protein
MYRCTPDHRAPWRACAVLALLAVSALQPVAAQLQRHFPQNALRGRFVVVDPPQIELNGHSAQLSPGARIRNQNNLMELSAGIVNQTHIVNYTVDPLGLVNNVWILTDEERAKRPWPTTAKQASEWTFDYVAQTWTRP